MDGESIKEWVDGDNFMEAEDNEGFKECVDGDSFIE